MIFACMPAYDGDEREAILLAQSIRQYGGRFSDAVLLVLAPQTSGLSFRCCEALTRLGATIVQFALPETALSFPYAQKVFAAAAAEKIAGGELLVWMDSDSLILFPPEEFDLPPGKRIGCCPVHLKNISSGIGEPVNGFWQAVYEGCGTEPEQVFPVITTIDQVKIRAQMNAGLLVVRAQAGLLQAWRKNFEHLFLSPLLEPFYAEDRRFRIFVHQAILSATLLACCATEEFHLFSSGYNIPLFLRERFQFSVLNPITCRYDEYSWFADPAWSSGSRELDHRIKILLENSTIA